MVKAIDGETRESTDLGPVEINLGTNVTTEVVSTTEAGTTPKPSSTTPSGSAGTVAAETGCGEGTMSWT